MHPWFGQGRTRYACRKRYQSPACQSPGAPFCCLRATPSLPIIIIRPSSSYVDPFMYAFCCGFSTSGRIFGRLARLLLILPADLSLGGESADQPGCCWPRRFGEGRSPISAFPAEQVIRIGVRKSKTLRRRMLPGVFGVLAAASSLTAEIAFGYDNKPATVRTEMTWPTPDSVTLPVAVVLAGGPIAESADSARHSNRTVADESALPAMDYVPVPEPATLGFLAVSVLAVAGSRGYWRA